MPRPHLRRLFLLCLCLFAGPGLVRPGFGAVAVDATPEAWSRSERISFARYLGAPAMMLSGGAHVAEGPAFANGRIEVDVAMHGQRGFVGVVFRYQDPANYEVVYLRPHKSRLPDAIQYTPTLNGLSAWQLYSGDENMAAAEFPHQRWVRLAVEFRGRRAEVFLDGAPEPALSVDLKGDFGAGRVGLWGRNVAHFANFGYEAFEDERVPPRPAFAAPAAVLDGWEITPSYEASLVDATRVPEDAAWTPVTLEAPGLVNISRYRRRVPAEAREDPDGARDLVWARTIVRSETAGLRRLQLGYSDAVTVLLNGRPIWRGSSAFGERYPFALGILGTDHDAVWLPLEAGENELVFAVEEVFGGWGFAARWADDG